MADFRAYRKANTILVIAEEEGDDRYFWQFQEGVRKRTPVASGIADRATVDTIVTRFGGEEI